MNDEEKRPAPITVVSLPRTNEQRILAAVERSANVTAELLKLVKEHADSKVLVEAPLAPKVRKKGRGA